MKALSLPLYYAELMMVDITNLALTERDNFFAQKCEASQADKPLVAASLGSYSAYFAP